MPARLTYKAALALAVCLLLMSAFGARAGSISSIDRLERDASESALVLQELPELVERPTVVSVALRAPDAHPVTDAGEVFNANAFPFGSRLLNNALADAVVYGLLKTPLSSTEPYQDLFTAGRAFRLKRGAGSVVPITNAVYLFADERGAVIKGGKLNNAEVYADPPVFFINRFCEA